MGYDATTERLIALKKLAGKAQTSNLKGLSNEGLPSGLTVSFETVFGENITTAPSDSSLYQITGKVEYLRFPATFIAGTATTDGRHGFELKLPSDYEENSSNPKAGTYPYIDNQIINITSGALQAIPPSFAPSYEAKPYYGGSAVKDSGTQILLLDSRDWYLDYFNGVFFQQDPPGTGDHAQNPDYVEGYLYIGDYLNISAGTIDSVSAGLGLTATGTTDITLAIDNSVVATLTGSQFTGNVDVTGSFLVKTGDFRVESAGEDEALFLDASSNQFYINKGATSFTTIIKNTNNEVFRAGAGGAIFNEYGNKNIDFRIESWNKPNALFIDSRADQVLILSGGGVSSPDEATFTDMNFFVSGSIGSKNSSVKGTSVFGGDVIASGSISAGPKGLALGGRRSKDTYFISSVQTPLASISVSSSDFSNASYEPDLIDISLNGQLLHSGTSTEVTNGSRDYYVSSATSLKFAFQLEIDDIIDVLVYNIVR